MDWLSVWSCSAAMRDDPIHLVFCLFARDSASPYPMALAATYSSIRQRTSASLRVHVLIDESVLPRMKRRLRKCMHPCDRIKFHAADAVPEALQLSRQMDGGFSPAIIWRAWLNDYLPHIKRCILLDCDLQVLMDIRSIWNIDLQGSYLSAYTGGKQHPQNYYDWIKTSPDNYFRMGVCLMDLERIRSYSDFIKNRKSFLEEALLVREKIKQAGLFEQSLYNRFFSDRYKSLPFPLVPANRLDQDHLRRKTIDVMLSNHQEIILDLKGWLNQSSISLCFWAALLYTPWREHAQQQFSQFRPLMPPRSEP